MKAVIGAYGEIALKFPNKESEREYRKKHGKNFLNVTTGAQAALHDAVKTMTPYQLVSSPIRR
ncbi:hypothetical protein [Corynebacterium ulcerans]|nr:hypothetical protein [Corynebacterium ulcerans]